MNDKEIKYEISKILTKISKKKINKKKFLQNFDYFEEGYVDSLNILKFLFEIENKYKINFINKELSNSKIKKIDNLVKIIKKKISK